MALISKMRSVFLLGYPQAPTRAPLGELRGPGGVETNTLLKIMYYINSRLFKSGDFKNVVSFAFRINSDPPRACTGVIIGGGDEAETYIPQKILCDISILGFPIVLISKMRSVFLLGSP